MPWSKQRRSSLLPYELVEEILYRIPIESLLRFKSICREWYALLSDRRFVYKHLDFSRKRFLQGRFMRGGGAKWIQLVNPETQAPMSLPIPDEFHSHILLPTIHCDGLLLCKYIESFEKRKLAVWNPILRQVKWIEPSNSYKPFVVYGFGYDNVSRDNYKILMFNNEFGKSPKVEIYEFKSKRWRRVDAPETPERCVYRTPLALSMNGNMYWVVAHENNMVDSNAQTFIQSFDFSTETFKPICYVPDPVGWSFDQRRIVSLSGFGGDRLSILHQRRNVEIGVWVTNKVTDAVVSWSKYFNIITRPHLPMLDSRFLSNSQTHFIYKTNKIMLSCVEEDDKEKCIRANVYEMGEGKIIKQVETGRWKWYARSFLSYCDVYVPSLVPVPE